MFFLKLWRKGIRSTSFLVASIIVFIILIELTQNLEIIFFFFLPQKYIFWGMPFLFIIFILTPLIGLITNGKLGNFIASLVKKIPFLNVIFRKEETITKGSIPAAVELNFLGSKSYLYGFVTGMSKNVDNGEKLVSMLLPSIPVIFTAIISVDVSIKNVKEVEIINNKGRKQAIAAIIQKKCLSFGQPLGEKIRFKNLEEEDIEKSLKE